MKPLLLLIITILFASNVYAEPEELDREKYYYFCDKYEMGVDKHGNSGCKGIKEGDVLIDINVSKAVLYCDPSSLMFESTRRTKSQFPEDITCIYNGKPIKEWKELK